MGKNSKYNKLCENCINKCKQESFIKIIVCKDRKVKGKQDEIYKSS